MSAKDELLFKLGTNRRLAHVALFPHRHPNRTPDFHFEIIDDWHSNIPWICTYAFRGGGKSTIGEEATAIEAAFKRFRNCVILGESAERAAERLGSIKHELETNEDILQLFGDLQGPTWNEDKVILSNGVVIQSLGREQSMRGVKHHDQRPDRLFVDDYEDEEAVANPEIRARVRRKFFATVLPALAPNAKIRVVGTPLDNDALLTHLEKDKRFMFKKYPWEYKNAAGERVATWADRFPLEYIDETQALFARQGMLTEYMREYMCQAEDPGSKAFTADMFKTEAKVRTWHPTFAFYDPARTVKATSAHTGKVVFSWIGAQLLVWSSDGQLWRPDQLIDDIFKVDDEFNPVTIGFEEDGLHEWVAQPLRQEMTRRQHLVPIRPYKAPKGKGDFIRSLQPFFKSGEVVFVGPQPVLQSQLLSFPTGRIDVPNALAYALRMRPGQLIYDSFTGENVIEQLTLVKRSPAWLIVNAEPAYVTAILAQYIEGALHVVADWVREGDAGTVLGDIAQEAQLKSSMKLTLKAPPKHFNAYDTIGLRGAAAQIPAEIMPCGPEALGREEIRDMFTRRAHGRPAVLVSQEASWSLRAFTGGYARDITKSGISSDHAREGIYKTLMEGLESFCALLKVGVDGGTPARPHYAYTEDGRKFLSALPRRG